jgi:hypothetical protein
MRDESPRVLPTQEEMVIEESACASSQKPCQHRTGLSAIGERSGWRIGKSLAKRRFQFAAAALLASARSAQATNGP